MSQSLENTEQLSADARRRLLADMLQKAKRPEVRALSLGQERLWLMARLYPESPLYNIAVAYHLRGPLDLPALELAVRNIEERHAVLRTTFHVVEGQPVQRISPDAISKLSVIDLEDVDQGVREAKARSLIARDVRQPFDLSQRPLWRAKIYRGSADDHVLVLTMHHIVSDAWSFYIFSQELTELYDAFRSGRPSRLPGLPIQYADFAQRRREWLTGGVLEEQVAFWRKHLEGHVPNLKLPNDRPRSIAPIHQGACQSLSISARVTKALLRLSQQESGTLFMTFSAGMQALLHQYSGQKDLVVCSPVSGRHRSQSRELIGYFNNILPMRFDLHGDPTFLELLRRTRRVALDAYKHQDLPLQMIVDSPNLNRVSLTRLLFSLDIEWPPRLDLRDLTSQALAVRPGTADFDLSVSLWVDGDLVRGVVEYKTELFDESTIARMIADYERVLENFALDPARPISSLPPDPRPGVEPQAEPIDRQLSEYQPPQGPLELRLIKEWEDVLGIRPIGHRDDLFELGASSLAVARLAERLQKTFQVELPLATIFQARTPKDLADVLRESGSSLRSTALAPIKPDGSYPPLFLCEGVGIYYPLARHVGKEQPIHGLVTEVLHEYPQIEALAAHYVAETRAVQPEGPYFLGGLSFGGLVAFEMAQQLHACGQRTALLALFDTPGPGAFTPKPFLRRCAGHLSNLLRFGLPYLGRKVLQRLRKLQRLRRKRKAPPENFATHVLSREDRLQRLFSDTASRYAIRPYPGRVTLFILSSRDAMQNALFDPAVVEIDPYLGWGRVAAGGVELHDLPGGHISIFKEPHVQVLGAKLRDCLDRARAGGSS
jgi:thioesterase domain-containing protein/acyl carrier protein